MARTREQEREHQRQYRASKAAAGHAGALAAASESGESAVDLVRAELDSLPGSKTMFASVAAALGMARVLDDPAAVPQHPAAAGQLRQIMAEIRDAKPITGKSSLAMIRGGRAG